MSDKIIDGKAIAATIRGEIKQEVDKLREQYGDKGSPGLGYILVGERKDSQTYVRMKKRACDEVGITSYGQDLPADVTQEDLLKAVQDLNSNPAVDGILVQLPLPDHINEEQILNAISIEKDVDGFHPINIGRLSQRGREPLFVPCTPRGCVELLRRSDVKMEGANAVVLGRSNIVGMPAAMLLVKENATVTICHSRTVDLPAVVKEADIVIAAIGRAEMVKADWIKPGAAVIDVGMNSVDDVTRKSGYRLTGDVDFKGAVEVAGKITPVPGGVGPMTIAMLLKNTVDSARRRLEGKQ